MLFTETDAKYIHDIHKCKSKINYEELKIADSQFNIDVFTDHLISLLHHLTPVATERCLEIVWNNMNKDEKDDKFKGCYDFLKEIIKYHIIDDVECTYKKSKLIEEVTRRGYEGYGYVITFYVNKIKFNFTIPVVDKINKGNYIYADEGRYDLSYTKTGSFYHSLARSYDLKDLHKAFKSFIESGCED